MVLIIRVVITLMQLYDSKWLVYPCWNLDFSWNLKCGKGHCHSFNCRSREKIYCDKSWPSCSKFVVFQSLLVTMIMLKVIGLNQIAHFQCFFMLPLDVNSCSEWHHSIYVYLNLPEKNVIKRTPFTKKIYYLYKLNTSTILYDFIYITQLSKAVRLFRIFEVTYCSWI